MKTSFFLLIFLFFIAFYQVSSAGCENLYKISDSQCGQLCLSSAVTPYAIEFGGVSEGTCSSQGYSLFDHTQQVSIGPFGNFTVSIYKKAAILSDSSCQKLYKIEDIVCIEACIDSNLFPYAEKYGQKGTCSSQGYNELVSSSETFSVYKKSDNIMNFLGDSNCENLYKVNGTQCGQLCVSATVAPFAIQFGGVTEGTCSSQGFTKYDHDEQVSAGPFGSLTVSIYKKASLFGDSNCENLYKVDNDQCGQLCLSASVAPYAIQFGGVSEGTCASQGFTKFDHNQDIAVGPFGNFSVAIYKKSALLGDSNCENLYKINGSQCGQLCVSAGIAPLAIQFGGVTEGTCSSQGFTKFDHDEQVSAGPLGSLTVNIYTRPSLILKDSDCENLYKVENSECGQLCVSTSQAPYIIEFGAVIQGTCASQGYTQFDSTNQVNAGPFGTLNVDFYKKPVMFLGKRFQE